VDKFIQLSEYKQPHIMYELGRYRHLFVELMKFPQQLKKQEKPS